MGEGGEGAGASNEWDLAFFFLAFKLREEEEEALKKKRKKKNSLPFLGGI